MKLLIVDDSAMVRRLIESAYRGSVFTDVKTAADGMLAVTMYKQFSPDVVTLDITMPHMDGLAALAEILQHNPHAKVLVISALADHHTAIEALKRGAAQFICKPFTAEELRASLDEVLNPPTRRRGRKSRRQRSQLAVLPDPTGNPGVAGVPAAPVPAAAPPQIPGARPMPQVLANQPPGLPSTPHAPPASAFGAPPAVQGGQSLPGAPPNPVVPGLAGTPEFGQNPTPPGTLPPASDAPDEQQYPSGWVQPPTS